MHKPSSGGAVPLELSAWPVSLPPRLWEFTAMPCQIQLSRPQALGASVQKAQTNEVVKGAQI